MSVLLIPLVVALLVGVTSLYVAGEFATVSARRARLEQMAAGGNRLARALLPILKDPLRLDNLIAASQVGISLASLILGIYGQQTITPLVAGWLARWTGSASAPSEGAVAVGVLLILTTLMVVFGELLPKSIALQYPEQTALATALPMRWSAEILFRPLIALLNGSGRLLLRLFRAHPGGEHSHVHSPEEIIILVQESHKSGLLDASERRMLRSVFRVSEISAEQIAVPRTRILTAEVSQPLQAVLLKLAGSAYSRIPIYENDIDHVIGFVHLRDLFNLYRSDPGASIRGILREMPYVPASLPVNEVWNRMNDANSYLAVVLDEYGGTNGMITREDVVEELFGELQDEFDQEPALIRSVSAGRLVVRGDMHIATLNDLLGTGLPHEDVYTVAGLIEDALGRIPAAGDRVELAQLSLTVEAVSGNTVTSISVSLPTGASLPDLDEEL
jgi:CBS domain containing-hemolysin-like protein